MNSADWLPNALTLTLLTFATASDLRSRRIPNRLTVSVALLGIALQIALSGWSGAQQATLGWLVGFAILAIPCLLGWMGGGDVKLLAAVGALQGPALALSAGLYGTMFGGLLSLAVLLRQRATRATASGPIRRTTLPYGPALAIGTLVAIIVK